MSFNKIRQEIELIFEQYRKHKYYTLFINDYNTNITSSIDEVGGGRSNQTSDKVANAALKIIERKEEAREYVELIERAVNQLPSIEREIIKKRYMSKNHDYISDYTIYEIEMDPPMSRPTYIKIRNKAMQSLYNLVALQIL